MTLKRFFRDFAILLGFCGAFYCLTVMMGRLDDDPPDNSDFSEIRKRADVSMRTHDWKSASADYLSLAKKDPYNGHVWYRCASMFNAQRNEVFQSLQTALAEAGEAEDSSDSSEELLNSLRADLDRLSDQSRKAYKKAKEFARYRADSLLNLAAIESYEGNNSQSLDYLEEFVGQGNFTARGLERYRVFGVTGPVFDSLEGSDEVQDRLHSEKRFWEIVRRERRNHSR